MDENSLQSEVARFLNAWFGVRQLIQAANFNRFQKAGLSATQFMALNLIPSSDCITIGEVARKLNLKPATVAKTIDSLEARKMVKRSRDPLDRRVILLTITKTGARMQNSAAGQFRDYIAGLFRSMRSEERHGLLIGLESLVSLASLPR